MGVEGEAVGNVCTNGAVLERPGKMVNGGVTGAQGIVHTATCQPKQLTSTPHGTNLPVWTEPAAHMTLATLCLQVWQHCLNQPWHGACPLQGKAGGRATQRVWEEVSGRVVGGQEEIGKG